MEDQQTTHPDFVKGFNEGYIIAKHMPDIAVELSKVSDDSNRSAGFRGGIMEYNLELKKSNSLPWLKSHSLNDLSKEKDKEDFDKN